MISTQLTQQEKRTFGGEGQNLNPAFTMTEKNVNTDHSVH